MVKLNVDVELQAKLTQSGGPLELCDELGRTIGYFQPAPAPGELKEMSPFSDEEIERFRQQREGRPLPEIWKDLDNAHGS